LAVEEFGNGIGDASDLIIAELGIHRKRENFVGGVLGVGKIADFVTERGVDGLQVKRHRIINGAANFSIA
jgi:hypothetical protein